MAYRKISDEIQSDSFSLLSSEIDDSIRLLSKIKEKIGQKDFSQEEAEKTLDKVIGINFDITKW